MTGTAGDPDRQRARAARTSAQSLDRACMRLALRRGLDGRDRHDILLIGEVDARLDPREKRGELRAELTRAHAERAAHHLGRGSKLRVARRCDSRRDSLRLIDREPAGAVRAPRKLAGTGKTRFVAGLVRVCKQPVQDHLDERRAARA